MSKHKAATGLKYFWLGRQYRYFT